MAATRVAIVLGVLAIAGVMAEAQSPAARNISGAWVPMGGGRGADPKIAPPPATPIVLKPEYAKAYEARRTAEAEAVKRGEPVATPAILCLPYGMPRMMTVASYPLEILQTAGQVTIITEAFSEVRRVYVDQPQLPIDEVPPGFYGHSVGRWDGDTFVIDTVGIKPSVLSYNMLPHSDRMRITERMRLVTPDVLHDQITIEDPVVLEKPFTYTLGFRRLPDYKMVEFVCENNREYIDEQGRVRMRVGGSQK
ncbi:MAG TPA: hypothetical protein VFD21_18980 [Vicinamibacterales bacterium]|nr:hypothetical protein [Vicinamibacterales bacterium]